MVFWIPLIVISSMFFAVYIKDFPWNDPRFGLADMINGTAHKPFIYRVLVPSLIKIALSIYPLRAQFYASILMYIFLVGFGLSFRFLVETFREYDNNSITISLAVLPALFLLRLPYPYAQVYDLATLCLFTLGLALMARNKWPAFAIVYFLGCLNKETAILLSVVFIIYFHRRITGHFFLRLLLTQVVIYGVIRIWLMWQYRNNPGDTVEFNLSRHMIAMALLPVFTTVYSIFGALGFWIIFRKWESKPLFLRQTAVSVFPLLLVLYLLFGSPFEFRVFYEIFPVMFLLTMPVSMKPSPTGLT